MYGDDLAFVHDAGFGALAEAAARHLLDLRSQGTLLDIGCGSGLLSRPMADAGFSVHGIDVSPAMVALAQERVPEGDFRVGDVVDAPLPPCDVAAAVGEVLNYACADATVLEGVLGRVASALRPGGVLLFDLATHGRAAQPTQAEHRGADWRVAATAHEEADVLVRRIDTWRIVDGVERHHHEVHRLRLFDPDEALAALHAAGFEAQRLGGYDDFGFQVGWDGFEARRLD